jgi:hypothetical protein
MSNLHKFIAPPRPFTIAFPQSEIDDLNRRLDTARWPLVDTVVDDKPEEERGTAFGMGYGECDPA